AVPFPSMQSVAFELRRSCAVRLVIDNNKPWARRSTAWIWGEEDAEIFRSAFSRRSSERGSCSRCGFADEEAGARANRHSPAAFHLACRNYRLRLGDERRRECRLRGAAHVVV